MTKVSVLQICSYYVGSKLYQNLFSALEALDIKQDVYVFTHKGYNQPDNDGGNVIYAPCYRRYERLIFHLKHGKVLRDIKTRIEPEAYNLAHAHSLFSNGYIAYRLKKEFGLPYIVAVRNTDVNTFFKRVPHLRGLGVNILKEAHRIIFISKPYKDYTLSHFVPANIRDEVKAKAVVIANGIDDYWHQNRFYNRTPPKQKTLKLMYAGQISRNKNVGTTIEACELLRDNGYKVGFTVVGRFVHKRYSRLLKKHPFIQYAPHSSKKELIRYYRESDIFVMPSRRETFGLVYAEAMSQGLPVIYTRGQSFDGQFPEGKVGYSVKHDSAAEIAEKTKLILENYKEISNCAVANVVNYDWGMIAKNYSRLYLATR